MYERVRHQETRKGITYRSLTDTFYEEEVARGGDEEEVARERVSEYRRTDRVCECARN